MPHLMQRMLLLFGGPQRPSCVLKGANQQHVSPDQETCTNVVVANRVREDSPILQLSSQCQGHRQGSLTTHRTGERLAELQMRFEQAHVAGHVGPLIALFLIDVAVGVYADETLQSERVGTRPNQRTSYRHRGYPNKAVSN
jgi:hypothetical protein